MRLSEPSTPFIPKFSYQVTSRSRTPTTTPSGSPLLHGSGSHLDASCSIIAYLGSRVKCLSAPLDPTYHVPTSSSGCQAEMMITPPWFSGASYYLMDAHPLKIGPEATPGRPCFTRRESTDPDFDSSALRPRRAGSAFPLEHDRQFLPRPSGSVPG